MPKSKSCDASERDVPAGTRSGSQISPSVRLDAAHEMAREADAAPIEPRPRDLFAAEQLRLQAEQLAAHLRTRQQELDHRGAELNARIARWEADQRNSRLWAEERDGDLIARTQTLADQERQLAARLAEIEKRELKIANREEEASRRENAVLVRNDELLSRERELRTRLDRLAVAEENSRKRAAEAQQDRSVHHMAEQLELERNELRRQAAELNQKRQTIQRRSDHVDQCRLALQQLRADLGREHREVLEIRLATEELWAQLSGAAPPAALVRSLGQIRTKLADEYRLANAELAEQRKELEAIRKELLAQHTALAAEKLRFEQWTACREQECDKQASRLIARERQIGRLADLDPATAS